MISIETLLTLPNVLWIEAVFFPNLSQRQAGPFVGIQYIDANNHLRTTRVYLSDLSKEACGWLLERIRPYPTEGGWMILYEKAEYTKEQIERCKMLWELKGS